MSTSFAPTSLRLYSRGSPPSTEWRGVQRKQELQVAGGAHPPLSSSEDADLRPVRRAASCSRGKLEGDFPNGTGGATGERADSKKARKQKPKPRETFCCQVWPRPGRGEMGTDKKAGNASATLLLLAPLQGEVPTCPAPETRELRGRSQLLPAPR